MLGKALELSALGCAVFPCSGKVPITPDGFKSASKDLDAIIRMWHSNPRANIAIATGEISGVDVIDVDPRNGGIETFAKLQAEFGPLPATIVCNTGRGDGGKHYYLKHSGKRLKKELGPGVDIKTNGGYVMAPPSIHPDSGNPYTWADGNPIEASEWPEAWLKAATKKNDPKPVAAVDSSKITANRNVALASEAGALVRRGWGYETVGSALQKFNLDRCAPPLDSVEVEKIAKSICNYKPGPRRADVQQTDLGNAMLLAERHGDKLRWCKGLGWLVWDGWRWQSNNAAVMELAKDTVRWILFEAIGMESGPEQKKAVAWALKSQSKAQLTAMVDLAKSSQEIYTTEDKFDADPWLLNCANGTIELKTGTLREHRQSDLITKMTPVAYRPEAKREMWEASLTITTQINKDLNGYLKRFAGYALTGTTGEQEIYIAYGLGGNGKTVFYESLKAAMGEYAGVTRVETLLSSSGHGSGIPNDIAALRGLRLVLTGEPDQAKKLKTGVVKQLTGGDTISARFMRQEFFQFSPTFKLVIATNYQPEIEDTDEGIWRRVRMLPFNYTIQPQERIVDFHKILIAEEIEGILAWAVEGCLEWQKIGMDTPTCVSAATGDYRAEQDVFGPFFEDRCLVGKDFYKATPTAIMSAIKEWCSENSVECPTAKALATLLRTHGIRQDREKTARRSRFYVGIAVKSLDTMEMG